MDFFQKVGDFGGEVGDWRGMSDINLMDMGREAIPS